MDNQEASSKQARKRVSLLDLRNKAKKLDVDIHNINKLELKENEDYIPISKVSSVDKTNNEVNIEEIPEINGYVIEKDIINSISNSNSRFINVINDENSHNKRNNGVSNIVEKKNINDFYEYSNETVVSEVRTVKNKLSSLREKINKKKTSINYNHDSIDFNANSQVKEKTVNSNVIVADYSKENVVNNDAYIKYELSSNNNGNNNIHNVVVNKERKEEKDKEFPDSDINIKSITNKSKNENDNSHNHNHDNSNNNNTPNNPNSSNVITHISPSNTIINIENSSSYNTISNNIKSTTNKKGRFSMYPINNFSQSTMNNDLSTFATVVNSVSGYRGKSQSYINYDEIINNNKDIIEGNLKEDFATYNSKQFLNSDLSYNKESIIKNSNNFTNTLSSEFINNIVNDGNKQSTNKGSSSAIINDINKDNNNNTSQQFRFQEHKENLNNVYDNIEKELNKFNHSNNKELEPIKETKIKEKQIKRPTSVSSNMNVNKRSESPFSNSSFVTKTTKMSNKNLNSTRRKDNKLNLSNTNNNEIKEIKKIANIKPKNYIYNQHHKNSQNSQNNQNNQNSQIRNHNQSISKKESHSSLLNSVRSNLTPNKNRKNNNNSSNNNIYHGHAYNHVNKSMEKNQSVISTTESNAIYKKNLAINNNNTNNMHNNLNKHQTTKNSSLTKRQLYNKSINYNLHNSMSNVNLNNKSKNYNNIQTENTSVTESLISPQRTNKNNVNSKNKKYISSSLPKNTSVSKRDLNDSKINDYKYIRTNTYKKGITNTLSSNNSNISSIYSKQHLCANKKHNYSKNDDKLNLRIQEKSMLETYFREVKNHTDLIESEYRKFKEKYLLYKTRYIKMTNSVKRANFGFKSTTGKIDPLVLYLEQNCNINSSDAYELSQKFDSNQKNKLVQEMNSSSLINKLLLNINALNKEKLNEIHYSDISENEQD